MKYEIMDRFGSSRYLNDQLDQLTIEVNMSKTMGEAYDVIAPSNVHIYLEVYTVN